MDFIHCNKCLALPLQNIKILLTNCGHMLCEKCTAPNAPVCAACGKSCAMTYLTANMEPSVKPFFTSHEELLTNMLEVIRFQNRNRKETFDNLFKIAMKYNSLKVEVTRIIEKYKKLEATLKERDKEIYSLRKQLRYRDMHSNTRTSIISPPQVSQYFVAQHPTPQSIKSSSSLSNKPFQNSFQVKQANASPPTPLRLRQFSPSGSSVCSSCEESDTFMSPVSAPRSNSYTSYRVNQTSTPGTPPTPNFSDTTSPQFNTQTFQHSSKGNSIGTSPTEQALRNLTFDMHSQAKNRKP